MFEELSSLSLTLQRNDLIIPQATSELRKTVTRLEALKFRAKAGGMLEKIQTMLAQQQGDERRFQGITMKGNLKGFMDLTNPQLKQHMEAAINIGVDNLKARSGCNMAAIQDEWQGLKILVSHNFKDKVYSGLWETMLTKDPYRHDYKNILELVQLMLVLPISAAQC
ncbi:hypothetical protein AAFF_G00318120 [Aldrovandia affinis]|uniref:Uncharacterized protein n=1 Tax=Aldrovandia affinis TaxID=143900 RepID=A0AAD7R7B1_9TELE|nr:hypothetical protein AAFF_G00318120 [Aldrovandia affinis]